MNRNRYLAEAVGTFALVFAGCGAIVVNDLFGGALSHVGVSLVFGLVVMAVIYAVGNISGAHINPAVTIAFVLSGRMHRRDVPAYLASQFGGALVAALTLWLLFPAHQTLGSTLPAIDAWRVFLLEGLLSFFLMFVVLNVSTGHKEKGIMAGVAIGGTVALEALFAGPVSGASMNPARSLAPALVSGELRDLWLYLIAPVLGMALAAPFCRWVQGDDCCPVDAEHPSENAA